MQNQSRGQIAVKMLSNFEEFPLLIYLPASYISSLWRFLRHFCPAITTLCFLYFPTYCLLYSLSSFVFQPALKLPSTAARKFMQLVLQLNAAQTQPQQQVFPSCYHFALFFARSARRQANRSSNRQPHASRCLLSCALRALFMASSPLLLLLPPLA